MLGLSGVRSRTSFNPGESIDSVVLQGFTPPADIFGV